MILPKVAWVLGVLTLKLFPSYVVFVCPSLDIKVYPSLIYKDTHAIGDVIPLDKKLMITGFNNNVNVYTIQRQL